MLREGGAEIVHVGVVAPVVAAVHAAHAVARALLGQVAARAAQHVRTRRADAAMQVLVALLSIIAALVGDVFTSFKGQRFIMTEEIAK